MTPKNVELQLTPLHNSPFALGLVVSGAIAAVAFLTFIEGTVETNVLLYVGDGTPDFATVPSSKLDIASSGPNFTPGTAGSGRPHNNMPPYIALHFCKKK